MSRLNVRAVLAAAEREALGSLGEASSWPVEVCESTAGMARPGDDSIMDWRYTYVVMVRLHRLEHASHVSGRGSLGIWTRMAACRHKSAAPRRNYRSSSDS